MYALTALTWLCLYPLLGQSTSRPADAVPGSAATQSIAMTYEVASIRPHKPGEQAMGVFPVEDGFLGRNLHLSALIALAYRTDEDSIEGGPNWIRSESFDVVAKVAESDVQRFRGLSHPQQDALLQSLLADRFHLRSHYEDRMRTGYRLVLAGKGIRLVRDSDPQEEPHATLTSGHYSATGISIAAFANQLGALMAAKVRDDSGLSGVYKIDLNWSPDQRSSVGLDDGKSSQDDRPGLSTALREQLGLKLISLKLATQVIVVDAASKPTEN